MLMTRFQKSKVGGLPAFVVNTPAAATILESAAQHPEQATWLIDTCLRKINESIKLYDQSGTVWSSDKFWGMCSEAMAQSTSSTFSAEEFMSQWATNGLRDIVESLVEPRSMEQAKALLAHAVKHGGKGQLSQAQCAKIIERFGDDSQNHEVLAIAVSNAKTRKAELDRVEAALMDF